MLVEIENMDDGTTQPSAEAPPPPAPAPVIQQIDPRALAREIVSAVNASQQSNMSAARRTATEVWTANQLREGTSPKVIKSLLELKEAERMDDWQYRADAAPLENLKARNAAIWNMVGETFDALARNLSPGVKKAKPALLEDFRQKFHSDKEFADEVRKIDAGQWPDRGVIEDGLAKTVDSWLKEVGAAPRQLPVNRGSSKPSAPQRQTDPLANLNRQQEAMYKTIKGDYVKRYGKEKGESLALSHVQKIYDD
jgi:hypothetical protein